MKITVELKELAEELVNECNAALHTAADGYVSPILAEMTASKGRLILSKIGSFADIWKDAFEIPKGMSGAIIGGGAHKNVWGGISVARAERVLGAARSIQEAIVKGRLSTIEDEVGGQILGDLMDQAEVLLRGGYYLACCVVLRAILEERLRKLCTGRGCLPSSARPGIEEFNQSLFAQSKTLPVQYFKQTDMKWVQAMSGIGNDAAHNKRKIEKEDAERMIRDVVSFLAQFAP